MKLLEAVQDSPKLELSDLDLGAIILEYECDEKGGKVTRTIREFLATPRNIRLFWEQARRFDFLFAKKIKDDFSAFVNMFFMQGPDGTIVQNGLFYVVDNFVGLYYLTDISEYEASVHYTFFDGRQRGRRDMTKEMIRYIFRTFDFNRITTQIPVYVSSHVFTFVEGLGFVKEGCYRKAMPLDGKMFDIKLYGMLKAEALNG